MSHHHHHHDEQQGNLGQAFFLNLGITLVEFAGGLGANSVAILSNAVHDLGDCLSIGLAWLLEKLGRRRASERFSYGFRRFSLIGALVNSLVLVVGSVFVLVHAVPRLWDPQMPHAGGMLGLAVLGVVVNGIAVWRVSGGKSLNSRVISWHLLEDVLGWLVVLIVSVVLFFVRMPILDPLLSIGVTVYILYNVVGTLMETMELFLQRTPRDMDLDAMAGELEALPHVADAHHVHLWSLDGEHHVLTAHLRLREGADLQAMRETRSALNEVVARWGVSHTTVEIELPEEECRIDGHVHG